MNSIAVRMATCLSVAVMALPSLGVAQAHAPTAAQLARRVRVTVAIAETLRDPQATAMIYRRANKAPHDVIVMPRAGATGDVLNAAIAQLLVARELQGDTTKTDNVIRVASSQTPKRWPAHDKAFSNAMVSQLLSAQPHDIPGIGRVASDEIYLRRNALHGKISASSKP